MKPDAIEMRAVEETARAGEAGVAVSELTGEQDAFSLFYEHFDRAQLEAEYTKLSKELAELRDRKYTTGGVSSEVDSINDLTLIEWDVSVKKQDTIDERIKVISEVQIPLLQKMLTNR